MFKYLLLQGIGFQRLQREVIFLQIIKTQQSDRNVLTGMQNDGKRLRYARGEFEYLERDHAGVMKNPHIPGGGGQHHGHGYYSQKNERGINRRVKAKS